MSKFHSIPHITLLIFVTYLALTFSEEKAELEPNFKRNFKRQFDLTLAAEHDNRQQQTDVSLEALANLWRSSDSKTTVDGGIKVTHSKNAFQMDNTKYTARFDVNFELGRK